MIGSYLEAFERRLQWMRYAELVIPTGKMAQVLREVQFCSPQFAQEAAETFGNALLHADTFYMDKYFCDMVDSAADSIPDIATFDPVWLQSEFGWMYLAEPFDINPAIHDAFDDSTKISAVSWRRSKHTTGVNCWDKQGREIGLGEDVVEFLFYGDLKYHGGKGFFPVRGIPLGSGKSLSEAKEIDSVMGASYERATWKTSRAWNWAFAALYLMSQRLSTTVNQRVDRAARRRAERAGIKCSDLVKIITLRRMQEDREREGVTHAQVDWHWRWAVRGHWRNQYFPSDNSHRPVFIESYIKGPEGKPFKDVGLKLFRASR